MKKYVFVLLSVIIGYVAANAGGVPAFPGAEGFAKGVSGGRGGEVIYVTSLDDCADTDLKEGTLRWALKANTDYTTPRTILFKVSGTIHLTTNLKFSGKNTSILGQSAPGGGICLADCKFMLNGADNVMIRYIRFRCGDKNNASSFACENSKNIMIDHCSFSWSSEENVTMYDSENITMQWCILSEALYNSINGKGARGYGAQWGGENSSYHHNIFAHCLKRVPQINGVSSSASDPDTHDFYVEQEMYNNVIYNAIANGENGYNGRVHAPNVTDAFVHVNMVSNSYVPGPASNVASNKAMIMTIYIPNTGDDASTSLSKWYITGNEYRKNDWFKNMTEANRTALNADNWLNAGTSSVRMIGFKPTDFSVNTAIGGTGSVTDYVLTSPSVQSGITYTNAEQAYLDVVAKAGARWPAIDEVDARVLAEAAGEQIPKYKGIKALGIIDTPTDLKPAGADDTWTPWPDLSTFGDEAAVVDTDSDGMPDTYEEVQGLDKNDPADGAAVVASGYTNLEEYLNGIIEGVETPSNLAATYNADSTEVTLTWNGTDGATGYELERADITETTDTTFTSVSNTIAKEMTEQADNAALKTRKYIYRLRATTASGNTNWVRTVVYGTTGINSAVEENTESENKVKANYDVMGRKTNGKTDGVNITVYDNGKTEKTIVKD